MCIQTIRNINSLIKNTFFNLFNWDQLKSKHSFSTKSETPTFINFFNYLYPR